ncbi:MAG: hypothetical protein PHY80_02070 [Rickettsiales bacterium]|nr:hypothetical protein [Rickettsiales bacterium]
MEEPKVGIVKKKHNPEKERLVKKIVEERKEEKNSKIKNWQFVVEIFMSIIAIVITWILSNR